MPQDEGKRDYRPTVSSSIFAPVNSIIHMAPTRQSITTIAEVASWGVTSLLLGLLFIVRQI